MSVGRPYLTAPAVGLQIGVLPTGIRNAITDVEGVRVGHCTVGHAGEGDVQTGVTVVRPHGGNVFREKVIAGCHVVNGFGKSIGLMQIDELGQLESPIALTNTLSVPAVSEGLLDHLLAENPEIGDHTGSVNVVVAECNDSFLNDMRGRHVTRDHILAALDAAREGQVEQGAVGAGRGMSAFGLKGGIGTSSRLVHYDRRVATVGVLVLSNFGALEELVIAGRAVGAVLAREREFDSAARVGGSIIVVLATDAPLTERQLGRLLRRVQNGIARTGSATAHASGEVVIGFTTAVRIPHFPQDSTIPLAMLREDSEIFDRLFTAVTEATEEAILNSMLNAETVTGRDGARREGLPLERLDELLAAAEGWSPRG